ncbi:MAG TPA: S8 family serine peptidase [Kineosporiaceae bacterium]|nr:S8 family serine peptidase [Kineosporiaceae bacterium]
MRVGLTAAVVVVAAGSFLASPAAWAGTSSTTSPTSPPASGAARSGSSGGTSHVIVSGTPGNLNAVEDAVTVAGGTVRRSLPVIDGVAATVPDAALSGLAHAPGVRSVTPDAAGRLMSVDPVLGYDVTKDEGSLYYAAQVVHATQAWGKGVTGKGVDVALIDSGVVPVQGLTSGNVIVGPDLSIESQNPSIANGMDTFGHGTHMASIIAGRDAVATGSTYADSTSHQFTGIAPDARIVSIKVANSDGGADVSQVIAAIDWVTQNAHRNGLNIKVLNLSYGTGSSQDYRLDPLDYAVENAWQAGITVIVSAGNDGTARQELADPANDPMVVAVGAEDPNNSLAAADDTIPAFSQRGTTARAVDVIAPGVHLLGLRDPNGFIDQNNPAARVGTRFFRGSGTSQAAAVVSGEAALYVSKFPGATPDQVKDALMHNATPPTSTKTIWTGLGIPYADKLIGYTPSTKNTAQATTSTGAGSLEAARGGSHLTDGLTVLTGEKDIFGQAWNAAAWGAASRAGTSWNGGSWNGTVWTGTGMANAISWQGVRWTGADWSSKSWLTANWDSKSWLGAGWDSKSWLGAGWASSNWQASTWSSATWS